MFTRDIHSNSEKVDQALYDLKESITLARQAKERVLCLIVGYGSTGKTHKIKTAVLEQLTEFQNKKFIKEFIEGSKLDIFNLEYQKLKYKDLIPEKEKKVRNPGAIYIIV